MLPTCRRRMPVLLVGASKAATSGPPTRLSMTPALTPAPRWRRGPPCRDLTPEKRGICFETSCLELRLITVACPTVGMLSPQASRASGGRVGVVPVFRTSSRPLTYSCTACYCGGRRYGVGRERRAGDQPSIRTVEYINWHDAASVSASPRRRGLIGPGATPSSVGAGLGGSAKTFRHSRRELRTL